VKFKEMKKRKVMKSSQKEVSIEVSTSKCYDVISKEMQIKRLHERIKFFFYFFKFYMLMQFKTMKHDAIYLNSSIEALCVC